MAIKKLEFAGYVLQNNQGNLSVQRQAINTDSRADYGADPIGDGKFRMVPSGDIVSYEERCKRLG
jgi:hypothetical protein